MRLTAELIGKSASFMNALKERELDLRANKIPAIENLVVARDQYDTIDLTDNELRKLDNFPTLHRLRTLLASNNHISKFDTIEELSSKLPNLEMLVLNNNALSELQNLQPLKGLARLRYLSLIDCPVTRRPHYRLAMVHMLPQLRALDFRRITRAEREAAQEMFLTPSPLPQQVEASQSGHGRKKAFEPGEELEAIMASKKSKGDLNREKIEEAIRKATSLEEVQQLERILATGHVPDL